MPRALEATAPWIIVVAFVVGGSFFEGLDWAIGLLQELAANSESYAETSSPHLAQDSWILMAGVAVDLFTDGLMIGAGAAVGTAVGLVLALAAAPAQVPSGFVTIAALKRHGIPRRQRLIATLVFALVLSLGTPVGYWLVHHQSSLVQLSVLAVTAGMLSVLVVEEMAPRAHRTSDARAGSFLFLAGFGVFALIALYIR
jgi:ZIP family zinc transporter